MWILFILFSVATIYGRKIGPNQPCISDADCEVPNSACYQSSMCLCNYGYIAINKKKEYFSCIKAADEIGDSCTSDIQCEKPLGTNGMCTNKNSDGIGHCDCRPGSHYKHNICYQTAYIGDRCRVHYNCVIKSSDIISYCSENYCICPPGYHPTNNRTDCSPSSRLGGPCSSDDSCIALNTRCLGHMCTCKVDYALNNAQNKCLPTATTLGFPCEEDIQCNTYMNLSICDPIKRRCVCEKGNIQQVDGRCWRTIRLNESCTHRMECVRSGSHDGVDCVGGICQCTKNYILFGHDCIPSTKSTNSACDIYMRINLLIIFSIFVTL